MESLLTFFQTSPVPPSSVSGSLWLIIALPLFGAFVCGAFGKILGRGNVHQIALGTVGGSFLLSLLTFWTIGDRNSVIETPYGNIPYAVGKTFGTWFSSGFLRVDFGLSVDHLSGTMLLVITGVGFLIHVYSTSYMSHDEGYWRFFAYLNLFVAAMLTLVLADSLPLLFIGWEGVGLCSYLLIGFWYEDDEKAFAGRKAFITNRIGDFAFLVAAILLVLVSQAMVSAGSDRYSHAVENRGPLSFVTLEGAAEKLASLGDTAIATGPLTGLPYSGVVTAIMLLFLLAAAGKSAQLPLYVWLPDAMAGPTPVSALIHAATMVTSGVYLFCRMSSLLVLSPTAMGIIALVGGATALFAALIALTQTGIKKVLAYSTVSQLGFMFLGIGAGIFWAAFLHLVTHAFFKACLFLGAGSVMHGNDNEEDITKLGGLRKEMPQTWATFLVATLAITGIVPLSGFFSKDAILHGARHNHLEGHPMMLTVAAALGTVAALCTAFYMMRLYFYTFEGKRSPEAKSAHAHESSPAMTVPLVILAILSVVALVQGLPVIIFNGVRITLMEQYLYPIFSHAIALATADDTVKFAVEQHIPWGTYFSAWVIALIGGAIAYLLVMRKVKLPSILKPLEQFSFRKFFVDELYDFVILRPILSLARVLYRVVDVVLIDGLGVRGTAWLTTRTGGLLRFFQTGDAQTYAAFMVVALAGGLLWAIFKVVM